MKPKVSTNTPDTSVLKHQYDPDFTVNDTYRASLPDIQNADASTIVGAPVPIREVGCSNFRLPLTFRTKSGETMLLETSVTGSVSIDAKTKGINMSRIMGNVYAFKEKEITPELLEEILIQLCESLSSQRGRLKLSFSYPVVQTSLRSELAGYQYYPVAYEGLIEPSGQFRKYLHFDFIYSSACPCSSLLSEHARSERNIYSIPHTQRSKARISVEVTKGATVLPEDIREHCLRALKTETQVIVKREDEQAFAELNGAYVKFVEDAVRLLYEQLISDDRLLDFQATCVHLESLHSHDAVAVINRGTPGGFTGHVENFLHFVC